MKKTVRIVTIPLCKKGWDKDDLVIQHGDKVYWHLTRLGSGTVTDYMDAQAQQLLVLSDDEIQEGDWCTLLDSFGNAMLGLPQQYNSSLGHVLNKGLKKTIASYPQIEGTLPISKETVQAWIDSGTPVEGSITISDYSSVNNDELDKEPLILPKITPQGNLLLEFGEKEQYGYTIESSKIGEEIAIAVFTLVDGTKKSIPILKSIPTDEEIKKIAKDLRDKEFEKREECLTEDLIVEPLSFYEIGIIVGYKQALKDLGHI